MKKRIIIGMLAGCMAFTALPALPALTSMPAQVNAAVEDTAEPCADVVYWRFRKLVDGTIQKRRWNATRGYWVDPDWIVVYRP